MGFKLKLAVLACTTLVIAVGYSSALAPATTGGHFTTGAQHTQWKAVAHTPNVFTFASWTMTCSTATYEATTATATSEALTLFPVYAGCQWETPEQVIGVALIRVNGCHFQFTIGKKAQADNTGHLICPAGKSIEFEVPNARLHLPPQTFSGVSYKATTEFGVGALTIDFTASAMTGHCEAGFFCVSTTNWGAGLDGSLTMQGSDTIGNPVDIKATGTEG
jgi:hypothetical protein